MLAGIYPRQRNEFLVIDNEHHDVLVVNVSKLIRAPSRSAIQVTRHRPSSFRAPEFAGDCQAIAY